MTKFNLRIRPAKSQLTVYCTNEYQRRIKDENPEVHLITKAKDRERKRREQEKAKGGKSRDARMKKQRNNELQAIRQKNYRQKKKQQRKQQSQQNHILKEVQKLLFLNQVM